MRNTLGPIPMLLALSGGVVFGASQDQDRLPAATQGLLDEYPGLRAEHVGSSVQAIYGVPMTAADTPERAAQWWMEDHSAALGVGDVDLRLVRSNAVGTTQRFTVFVYQQFIDDLPVEMSAARLLVLNGAPNQVVYVGARLAQRPADGYAADSVDGASALASVQATPKYAHLSEWSDPELVVYYGEGLGETERSVRAWKFMGTHPIRSEYESYTFFVNAANGQLVFARDEVYHTDVDGHVDGMATPGVFPDTASNPEVQTSMESIHVEILGGNDAFSDESGDFVIANGGTSDVTVAAEALGIWTDVIPEQGSPISAIDVVTPPGPAELLLNDGPTQFDTAQVNAHIHTTLVHDFYKDRQPDFTGLDIAIPTYVNLNATCNAFYSPNDVTINFYNAAGGNGCPNTAYSTVISHEYGHFVVAAHGVGQGAFGEGLGDTLANMLYNTSGTGHDFFGPGGGPLRDALDVVPYPCGGAKHFCGGTLSGVWWQIKLKFDDLMGEEAGLAATQQLFTDWMEMTNGGSGGDSAHPGTAIEVLTVDDDDGTIGNGTPHRLEICEAFASRNIGCPALDVIVFQYPNGLPESLIDASTETLVLVNVVGVIGTPEPGTGMVSYSIDGGAFTTVAMTELVDNEYEATLPGIECLQTIDFYFSADDSEGVTHSDPASAPASSFSAMAGFGVGDNFEQDPGWTVSGDATTGHWDRGVPVGGGDRGDPPTDFDTSGKCFLTQNTDGDSDVDDGSTELLSIIYDLSALSDPQLTYARWYSNTFGNDPMNDIFVVDVSDDGGTTWVNLEVVGPTGPEVDGEWFLKTFRITDFVDITDQFRIRFTASDLSAGSVVEAGIDAFSILDTVCPTPSCEGDANGDGVVDPLDSGFVLARFGCEVGGGDPTCDDADQNDDGVVDPLDSGFVLARFGPCD